MRVTILYKKNRVHVFRTERTIGAIKNKHSRTRAHRLDQKERVYSETYQLDLQRFSE